MDWPLIGAVSAVTIVAGVVVFEVVAFVQSEPESARSAPAQASYAGSIERSATELPGFSTGRPNAWTPSFPLIPLIDPDRIPEAESPIPADQIPAPETPRKRLVPVRQSPPADLTKLPLEESKTAKLSMPEVQPRAEQWVVVVTAKASYFNLGGHVDKAGIVDSLASSYLRDALKSHKNFAQLPPEIRAHILTQNINLTKVAPYRGLLGMNDKTLEEEQAVRFERIVANR
jgi:hypothetical protein